MYDRNLILVCDTETGEWSIVHQSRSKAAAESEAANIRSTFDKTPVILIDTSDFINY